MNKLVYVSLCFILSTYFIFPDIGQAQSLGRTHDWIIEIETEELKHYLDFSGSPLQPIIKVAVTYHKPDERKATKYEDLYYKAGDPLGCRRHSTLNIGNDQQVALRVRHKSGTGSSAEGYAASNAILRVFLDAYLLGDMVAIIFVPASSFSNVVDGLSRQNFYPGDEPKPDEPVYSSIVLDLESEPSGSRQKMYYIGRTD